MPVSKKLSIPAIIAAIVIVLGAITVWIGGLGYNEDHEWQVLVYPSGSVEIVDEPGFYLKWFGSAKTWPRAMQFYDGGTAETTGTIRVQLPTDEDMRRTLNREFSANPENLELAITAHLTNVLKATGPTMSASEHQSARKAEFQQLVFEQTSKGIYRMRRVEKEVEEESLAIIPPPVAPAVDPDNPNAPIVIPPAPKQEVRTRRVVTTEIITDDEGVAEIGQPSPLTAYEINVVQLSVGDVDYDPKTRDLFEAKKEAFLAAEQSKAERMQEYEQTLMVVQKGLREKAEAEATANVEKATAVIAAEKAAEVAEQEQVEAETKAETLVKVALQSQEEAETEAKTLVLVAEQALLQATAMAKTAEQEALAITTLAAAEEEKIERAGAITEEVQILAEIKAKRDVEVAKALSLIQVPSVVMSGGSTKGEGGKADFKDTLISLHLLKSLGLIDDDGKLKAVEVEKIDDDK